MGNNGKGMWRIREWIGKENKNAAVARTFMCRVVAAFMADGECGRKGSAVML